MDSTDGGPWTIAVMGAGAVGCYYGGMLARAGHAVTLIARPEHVRAIERDGLFLDTTGFQAHVRLAASTSPEAVRGAKLVLVCVKSGDTERAAEALKPYLDPDAVVLSLQNGVDNAERLRECLPQVVAPAVVYVATEMAGPGHVKHHGRGELVIAPWARADERVASPEAVAAVFQAAGVPVQLTPDAVAALWSKLVLNCAYNALSAITQLPYGRVVAGEGVERVMRDLVDECLAVAHASGIRLDAAATWAAVRGLAQTMPAQLSSTAQDLARGRRSEIEHLNGSIVRRGEALGIATPVNRALLVLVRLVEAAR
ncbi:MAG TPA: ketopantoate reductase family protein [Methylibium sp.]